MIYTVTNLITAFFDLFCLFRLCNVWLQKREKLRNVVYILSLLIFTSLLAAAISDNILWNLSAGAVLSFLFTLLYKGKLRYRLLICAVVWIVATLMECFIYLLMSIFCPNPAVVDSPEIRTTGLIFSRLLSLLIISIICVCQGKQGVNKPRPLSYILVFAVFASAFAVFCRYITDKDVYMKIFILICGVFLSLTALGMMYLYERSMLQQENLKKKELAQLRLDEQIKHYKALLMSQEQLRKTKHDLKNHLIAIKADFESGKTEQGFSYINTLLEGFDTDRNRFHTGNTVIDAVMSAKQAEAERAGIGFHAAVQIPETLPIADEDLCVIFGNALDNAIEACGKVRDNPSINVSVVYRGGSLVCRIDNSLCAAADIQKPTSKQDIHNHGIGRMNIESALEKYHTVYKSYTEDGRYVLSFIFTALNFADFAR